MSIIRLEKLLKSSPSGDLENIVQTAQYMDRLTTALRAGLEPDLADNVIAASVRDGDELVVIASTSAWASKLRFDESRLLEAARGAGADVEYCRVTVSKNR